jgi:hypothetical protein
MSRFLVAWFILLLWAGIAVRSSEPSGSTGGPVPRKVVFKKIVIDPEFRSEGVAVADVNRDGKLDIVAGNFWYEAPDWKPHQIAPAQKFDPAKGYSNSFLDFILDVDGDGWPDQIVFGFPGREAFWRQNPRGGAGPWKEYPIVANAMNESPIFAKLAGLPTPVLVFPYDSQSMAWWEPNKDFSQGFTRHLIGTAGPEASKIRMHGLGVGDVNGDGRPDVLTPDGYWEAPKDPHTSPWKFVPAHLGPDCAQMITYDVNGDGLTDVLSSSAHGFGV